MRILRDHESQEEEREILASDSNRYIQILIEAKTPQFKCGVERACKLVRSRGLELRMTELKQAVVIEMQDLSWRYWGL